LFAFGDLFAAVDDVDVEAAEDDDDVDDDMVESGGKGRRLFVLTSLDPDVLIGALFRLCVRLCRRKSQFLRNTLPHAAQWYGLMSVWVSRCVLRFER
jgi:hypothetical protein